MLKATVPAAGVTAGPARDGGREPPDTFRLCLTRRERDAEVSRAVEGFSLNEDQARLLWTCARWFRPVASPGGGEVGEGAGKQGGAHGVEGGGGDKPEEAPPVVLVHGVFGELPSGRPVLGPPFPPSPPPS